MAKIIEKQSGVVEDLNEKLNKKEEKMKDALLKKDEIIGDIQKKLNSKELELQQLAAAAEERSKSAADIDTTDHIRITSLECDLVKMTEKVDELYNSLAEALEESANLQAEVNSKEERIVELQNELEDATGQLQTVQAASDDNSGSFARLRSEIENLSRERARLESDFADATNKLKAESEKVSTLTLEVEQLQTTKVELLRELDDANNELNLVDDTIEEELTEFKQQLQQQQDENAKLQAENDKLREQLDSNGSNELREAQQALVALDEEKSAALRNSEDRIKKLGLAVSECEEQVVAGEAKLNRVIREREIVVSDLKKELAIKDEYATQLKAELVELQVAVDKMENSPWKSKRSFGMAIDPDCDDDPDVEVSKLNVQVSTIQREKSMMESELRAKIDDRDKSISSLVMTSSKQESIIASLKKEVASLQIQLETKTSSESVLSSQRITCEAQKKEIVSLNAKLCEMSAELTRANKKLSIVSQELECAKDQLSTTQTTPDVADLAGRLAVSDQAQRMIKKDSEEKLRERDAAISNLLQTVQTNEKTIKSLKTELETCRKTVKETLEENQRLQHESEIFGKMWCLVVKTFASLFVALHIILPIRACLVQLLKSLIKTLSLSSLTPS